MELNVGLAIYHRIREIGRQARSSGLIVYLAIALTMMAALALYYVLKHKAFAFVDVGSDPFVQFYPMQLAEARQLNALHQLTWSFNIGLGAYLGLDANPIQLLTGLFPEPWQLGLRLPAFFLKLLLGGVFFLAFLRKLGFAPGLAIIGALGYTFSSYALINNQWDPNAVLWIQVAAYLFFIETYLREGSRAHAIAAGLTVGLGASFDLYTFSLLTALYVLSRRVTIGEFPRWRRLGAYGAYATLGFLLTGPIQFPNLHYLFDSPRVTGNRSALSALLGHAFQLNDSATIGSEIAGLFGKDLLGTADAYQGWANYFEGPGFYVGMLLLLCIPQLLGPAATPRERRVCVAGIALLAVYLLLPALRYAVYGFGHIAFRLSTLWISILLILLGLTGLRRALRSGPWRTGLLIGVFGVAAALSTLALRLPQAINVAHVVLVGGFVLAYAAIVWMMDGRLRVWAASILLPIFACELLLFAIPPMLERTAVNRDGSSKIGSYNDGTMAALQAIRQSDRGSEFYRIEKTYQSVFLCDALAQDYAGIKSYFFHGASLTRFVDHAGIDRPVAGNVSYIGSALNQPAILDLVGVKYILSGDRNLDGASDYEHLFDVGGISVYHNLGNLGFAHLHTGLISEADANQLPVDQLDERMRSDVVVADLASVRRDLDTLDARIPPNTVTASYSVVRHVSDIDLSGDISTPRSAVLLVSMPFDRGWVARLDDAVVPTFEADYGLTGLLVPPGLHELRLSYRPPGRELGNWLALASLGLLLYPSITRKLHAARASTNTA